MNGAVVDSNGSICHYSWKALVRNNSDQPASFTGDVTFVDKDGFAVDSANIVAFEIPAHSEREIAGSKMMTTDAAQTVARSEAKLSAR